MSVKLHPDAEKVSNRLGRETDEITRLRSDFELPTALVSHTHVSRRLESTYTRERGGVS